MTLALPPAGVRRNGEGEFAARDFPFAVFLSVRESEATGFEPGRPGNKPSSTTLLSVCEQRTDRFISVRQVGTDTRPSSTTLLLDPRQRVGRFCLSAGLVEPAWATSLLHHAPAVARKRVGRFQSVLKRLKEQRRGL
jgi:hypothetical protein